MTVVVQALLIGLVAAFGQLTYGLGTSMIDRPIVLGPLVGLVLGNPTQGIMIGATLELFFVGAVSVGAYLPPDMITGGVLATAFAIATGKGTEAAIALALPISMLALVFVNLESAIIVPMLGKVADKYAKKGNCNGVDAMHYLGGTIMVIRCGLICFLAFWLGSAKMQEFLNMIPKVVTDGMTIATGILPAIGFAMLAKMIMNKNVVPFFFLGFVLSAYLHIPVIGIAIIGLIIIFTWMQLQPVQSAKEVAEDDDF